MKVKTQWMIMGHWDNVSEHGTCFSDITHTHTLFHLLSSHIHLGLATCAPDLEATKNSAHMGIGNLWGVYTHFNLALCLLLSNAFIKQNTSGLPGQLIWFFIRAVFPSGGRKKGERGFGEMNNIRFWTIVWLQNVSFYASDVLLCWLKALKLFSVIKDVIWQLT